MTFFVSGSVFGWLALIWTGENLAGSSPFWTQSLGISRVSWSDPGQLLLYSVSAGLISAWVESLPWKKIDDNLAAPLAYALVLTVLLFLGH